MERREKNNTKRIKKAEVYGKRRRGRRKKRWMVVVQKDLKQPKLNVSITEDRAERRRRFVWLTPLKIDIQLGGKDGYF